MSDTTINIKGIIDEVARRHKIRLADDDPILATVTVTEHVHKLFAAHLERLVKAVADQATDRLVAQIETAKLSAAKLVNDAGGWSAENLKAASRGAADDISAAVTAALATVQADIQAARKAKNVAIIAAVVALVVGGGFLGLAFGFWMAGK